MDLYTPNSVGGAVIDGQYRRYQPGEDLPFPIARVFHNTKNTKFSQKYGEHPRG